MEVFGQPVDNLGASPGRRLPVENIAADLPVQQDELTIDGNRRLNLCLLNALFQSA